MRSSALVAVAILSQACGSAAPPQAPPVAPVPPPPIAATCAPAHAPVAATATATSAPLPPPPPPVPPAVKDALGAAEDAIAVRNFAAADKSLATAAAAAGDAPHAAWLVARVRAERFAAAGDFEHAAAAYVAVIPTVAKHPELPDEFWSHNAMMMIREAQGDPAAALAENDQATLCAARGTWDPARREKLAFQKDRWHRAYLTRMLAESRTGTAKQALVHYAQAALDDYRTQGFPDSIAVLEAYFAALDVECSPRPACGGSADAKRAEAVAAAKRVDPAKDDDLEDLYLVVVGLEAGGDHASAEAVKRVMRQSTGVHVSRAIMLRWLDLDDKRRGFTPWHARPGA